jgi:hypothetical protein
MQEKKRTAQIKALSWGGGGMVCLVVEGPIWVDVQVKYLFHFYG